MNSDKLITETFFQDLFELIKKQIYLIVLTIIIFSFIGYLITNSLNDRSEKENINFEFIVTEFIFINKTNLNVFNNLIRNLMYISDKKEQIGEKVKILDKEFSISYEMSDMQPQSETAQPINSSDLFFIYTYNLLQIEQMISYLQKNKKNFDKFFNSNNISLEEAVKLLSNISISKKEKRNDTNTEITYNVSLQSKDIKDAKKVSLIINEIGQERNRAILNKLVHDKLKEYAEKTDILIANILQKNKLSKELYLSLLKNSILIKREELSVLRQLETNNSFSENNGLTYLQGYNLLMKEIESGKITSPLINLLWNNEIGFLKDYNESLQNFIILEKEIELLENRTVIEDYIPEMKTEKIEIEALVDQLKITNQKGKAVLDDLGLNDGSFVSVLFNGPIIINPIKFRIYSYEIIILSGVFGILSSLFLILLVLVYKITKKENL